MYPKIALIGRVNTGKSTLFNCLIEQPKALVSPLPGTTRDRNYAHCQWQGEKFVLVDTAGVAEIKKLKSNIKNENEILEAAVDRQIKIAINEADLILFVLDIQAGILPADYKIGRLIRKSGKSTILVLNKADNPKIRKLSETAEYFQFGFGQPIDVSAINGSGTGDLLDEIVKKINRAKKMATVPDIEPIKVAIIGQPNVGKSFLLNTLLGEERVVVSSIPRTTREPIDTLIYYQNEPFLFVDTAGIRRKAKIERGIEQVGVKKSLLAVKRSDLVLMVFDITKQVAHQDKALTQLIIKNSRGLILVVNKIDKIANFSASTIFQNYGIGGSASGGKFRLENFIEYYQNNLPMAWWAPIVFVSAKTGENVKTIFDLIQTVEENQKRKIEQKELQNLLESVIRKNSFSRSVWRAVKLRQLGTNPPKFILTAPQIILKRKQIHQAQLNIIEKALRKNWRLEGTSTKIILSSK